MKRRINRRKLCGELRDLWRLCGAEDRERLACAEELSAKERLRLFCLACAYGCAEAGFCLCALGVKDLEEMRALTERGVKRWGVFAEYILASLPSAEQAERLAPGCRAVLGELRR